MRPSAARMYDYHLGGRHHFEIDRMAARQAEDDMPFLRAALQANRAFLRRAIHYCHEAGVRQYLDLGSGIPTVGNVHEIAQGLDPAARVAYVDVESAAVADSAELLAADRGATITHADMRDVGAVLDAPGVRDLLDLSRPVALLTVAVLHYLAPDDEVRVMLDDYRAALRGGGFLVLSHATADHDPVEAEAAMETYRRTDTPITARTHARVAAFLDGLEPVAPGLVDATRWRPDPADGQGHPGFWAAVASLRPATGPS